METKAAAILAVLLASIMFVGLYSDVSAFKKTSTSYKDGFNRGYKDGLDHPFDHSLRSQGHTDTYINGYIAGFRAGCLQVKGNNLATCNSAMDT